MKTFSYSAPVLDIRIPPNPSYGDIARAINALMDFLRGMRKDLAATINTNVISYVSQNDQPTPEVNCMMVWKDANASAGTPTHYLVYNDGGTIVTFASVNLAP